MKKNNGAVVFNIKRLGSIRNSSITLKKFMIFSGDSGLGKSYTTFLIHYLYVLLVGDRLENFFLYKGINFEELISKCDKDPEGYTFEFSELLSWINNDIIVYLRFLLGNDQLVGDINIEIPISDKRFTFKCKQEMISIGDNTEIYNVLLLNEGMSLRLPESSYKWGVFPLSLILRNYLQRKIFDGSQLTSTFLLPPSRGGLIGLSSTVKGLAVTTAGMYQEFLQNMDEIEAPFDSSKRRKPNVCHDVLPYLQDIIGGEIESEDNKLYYIVNNGERIPITAAASSVKELTPMFLLLKNDNMERYSVLFEEPEAHLHPSMQVKLAEILVFLLNKGAHFQITTHSDYFLRRINDLIKLHRIKSILPDDRYNEICDKYKFNPELTLDPDDIGAFVLKKRVDNSVEIISQDVMSGVPFDTFEKLLSTDVINSIELSDLLEDLES